MWKWTTDWLSTLQVIVNMLMMYLIACIVDAPTWATVFAVVLTMYTCPFFKFEYGEVSNEHAS